MSGENISTWPNGWSHVFYSEAVINISTNGKKINQKKYLESGQYPVIDQGQSDIGGYTNDSKIVIECDFPVIVFGDHTRIVKYVKKPFAAGADGVKVLQPQKCIVPKLLEYFTRYLAISIKDKGYARHYQWIAKEHIGIPPINEQHRIVAKIEELFSELDKGIESLKKAREQLKVYRQAVLKHAFEGKLTEKWREENKDKLETADQILARIKKEREARYQQQLEEWNKNIKKWEAGGKDGKKPAKPKSVKSFPAISEGELLELPALPTDWNWVRLGQLFSISPQNGIYKSSDYYGRGNYIVRIDDFYDGELIRISEFKRLHLSPDELSTYSLCEGDILINRVNSIEYLGKCCEIKTINEPIVFESNIMRLKILRDNVLGGYLTSYLASHGGKKRICKNAKHAVNQASINQTDVGMTPIPICAFNEQGYITSKLDAKLSVVTSQLTDIDINIFRSKALRQSILKKAFSGQLVEQNPNDEPASVLLERIKSEKEKQKNIAPKKKRTKKRKTTA